METNTCLSFILKYPSSRFLHSWLIYTAGTKIKYHPISPLLYWRSHPQLSGVLVIKSSQLPPFAKNYPLAWEVVFSPLGGKLKLMTDCLTDWLLACLPDKEMQKAASPLVSRGYQFCGVINILELLVGPGLRNLQLRPHPCLAFFLCPLFFVVALLLRAYFQ